MPGARAGAACTQHSARAPALRTGTSTRTRTWHAYLPARRAEAPALVFVLHGSRGDFAQARGAYAYEFDSLAEEGGFIPIYPDGVEGHWNDCRRAAPYSANTLDVDDVGFLRALVETFASRHGADRATSGGRASEAPLSASTLRDFDILRPERV